MSSSDHERFKELLLRYSQEPDAAKRKACDAELWAEFGAERAVLVLDMSGFSKLTLRHGIVHYLSMVRRMQMTCLPIVHGYGGMVVKFEADNAYAVFPDVASAVRAAIALNLAFDAANVITPEELDIKVSCGIDYGPILLIGDGDFFGNPVNLASKLGEDLAESGQILITRDALARVTEHAGIRVETMTFTVSGVEIPAASVLFRQPVA